MSRLRDWIADWIDDNDNLDYLKTKLGLEK
jgi:hypothetical protein